MCVYLPPLSIIARCRVVWEKCGCLADVGKARTSTRCVTPSLDSNPRNCSSDRVECPIVKSLAGSTLHEASTFDTRRPGRGRNSSRPRLMQRLTPKQDSRCPNVVTHVDQQQRKVAAPPQQSRQ